MQVHAEDQDPGMLEFEDADSQADTEDGENGEDFFNIEEKEASPEAAVNGEAEARARKLSASAAEWVPPARQWNSFDSTGMKWIKNDQVFSQPESRCHNCSGTSLEYLSLVQP